MSRSSESSSPTRFRVTSSKTLDALMSRRRMLAGGMALGAGLGLGRQAFASPGRQHAYALAAQQEELAIVIGTLGEASSINPFRVSDSEGEWRAVMLYDELIRVQPESFEPVPGIASEWTVDNLDITLTLNEVMFSDGSALTADDIVWNIEQHLNPEVASTYATNLESIDSVEAVDPQTVRITLKQPDAGILYNLRFVRPVPKAALEGKNLSDDPFFQKPVGAGPFVFESWSTGADFVMVRNEHYFEADKPAITKVTHRTIADAQSLVLALLNNEIDGSNYPNPAGKDQLEANQDLVIMVPPFSSPNGWMFNCRHELLGKKEVRQAIAMGLDREQFAADALMGLGKAGIGPIAPDSWAYDSALEPLAYDPKKAKQMITDAGAEGAELKFVVNAGNTMREDWLIYTEQALQQIGIKVVPETIEWATLVSAVTERQDFEVAGGDWMGVMAQPAQLYHQFYSSSSNNYSGYNNPDLDELLTKAKETIETANAVETYAEIQKILVDEVPFYFAWYRPFLHTINKRFTGYTDSGSEGLFYTLQDWTAATA